MKNQKITFTLILCTLACLEFLTPNAFGINPPPDGCYPGFTTAEGCNTLQSLTSGTANTALGWYSLFGDSTGSYNTGVGAGALVLNNGDENTAVGALTLLLNTTGFLNTAFGMQALQSNDNGNGNTATGGGALQSNTTGVGNTASGVTALLLNISGTYNTALGASAGFNSTGSGNVYIGALMMGVAGESNTTYIRNVNTTEQSASGDVAYVTVRVSDGRIGHQPIITRSAGPQLQKTTEELKSTVARQAETIAQLEKEMQTVVAQLKEQAAQIQNVSAQVELNTARTRLVQLP